MNRGDTNLLSFKLYKLNTTPKEYVDCSNFDEIEVQLNVQANFNSVKKLKSKGEVEWNTTNQNLVCSLTQEDTFALPEGESEMQVRLFLNNVCKGSTIIKLDINKCLSSEVLDD